MFGKTRVSQSILDAVNSVIGEEPVVENKKPKTMLSEEIVDFNIDPHTGQMIEVPDLLVSGYERKLGNKQVVMIEEEPTITPETLKGQILKKKDDKKSSLGKSAIAMTAEAKKRMLADDDLDETGFHMAAHAAKKSGASQFEFQGKKYPVTAKSHTEEYELDEDGNCVTPMKAKNIAKKEVKGHEKEMHKESMTFKERLLEKSVSTKQARTMAAAAHNPSFAKKVGIPQDVAKDFNKADKGTKMLSKAMKGEEVEMDDGTLNELSSDLLKRSAEVAKNKSKQALDPKVHDTLGGGYSNPLSRHYDSVAQKLKDRASNVEKKDAIKKVASPATMRKVGIKEEEVTESLKDVAKKILSKVGHPDDKGMRKDLQKKMGMPQTGMKPKKEEFELDETTGITDYNPKSQGGTRKELLAMYAKSGNPKHAEAARKAGATQSELKMASASMKKEEFEYVYEANIEPTAAKSRTHIGNLSHPIVNSVNHPKSGKEIGLITKQPDGKYHAFHSAAKPAHAQSGTFDNKDKAHQFVRDAHAKAIKSGTLKDKFLNKEEVEGVEEAMRPGFDYQAAAKETQQRKAAGYERSGPYSWKKTKPEEKKTQKEEAELDENAFTDYKTDKRPSIFAPKSHTPKKTEKGTMYTKNWSKKDMEHKDDDKMKKEAVDKEAEKHVRVDGETDMKTKTVDMLRGRVKVPADYHNKSKSYKVAMPVGEEMEHDDEKEDKALVKKMVKKDALKKEQVEEAFKGPEAGSGVGDHPFVTSEAKPLKNARELAKKTMARLKNEMLGKISN
jgi:hypothetical protein